MATALCMRVTPRSQLTHHLYPVPRLRTLKHTGVHLVSAEPGHAAELLGSTSVHGTVSTLGVDGFPHVHAR